MKVLAIETSCDETAAAIVESTDSGWVTVLGESVATSEQMHVKTGGIVPEVAAREQLIYMIPVIQAAIEQAFTRIHQDKTTIDLANLLSWAKSEIDAVAFTKEPGLIGSLLIGIETAKTLSIAWDKPLIPINHIHGHIFANWIKHEESRQKPPDFPTLALVVSGGHTELVLLENDSNQTVPGSTRDDAAGECFDKCARLLGLPYPGGKHIATLAEKFNPDTDQLPFPPLPRPLIYEDILDMSFSGLKAAFSRTVKTFDELSEEVKVALAYDLQKAVVEVLIKKLNRAIELHQPNSIVLAGGVAANSLLREKVTWLAKQSASKLYIPPVKYCMDNAAMIGAAAIAKGNNGNF